MFKTISKTAFTLFSAILSTQLNAAEIDYAPELRPHLDQLRTILDQEEWNNFGAARMPLLKSLNATAQEDDGTWFDFSPNEPIKIIRITGQTEVGDADKLAAMLRDPKHGYRSIIVMDGPGGVFGEAIKLGKLIHESIYFRQDDGLMGVVVLEGSQCLSACAVAAAWAGDNLFVEQGARLGFHLPFFPGEQAEKSYPAAQLLDFAYDIAQSYNELLIEGLAHRDLFREAYQHRRADSFFYLDTPFAVTRYGFSAVARGEAGQGAHIEGVGFDLVTALCAQKFELEQSKKSFVDNEYAVPYFHGETRTLGQMTRASTGRWFASAQDTLFTDMRCHFGADEAGGLHVAMVRDHTLCEGQEAGLCQAPQPRAPSPVTNHEMALVLRCETGVYGGKPDRVVARDVNARAEPSTGGQVLTKLKAGQTLRVLDCRVTSDKQTVWYKVQTSRGDAWASARYFKPW